ncbi:cell envelope integrity protein CreD [Bacteroidota bacterium]
MKNSSGNFFRSSSFKFIVIGTLSLALMIPAVMIKNLIREREMRNDAAQQEISAKWGLAQTITGPFITIPTEELVKENRKEITIYHRLHILPESLTINGDIKPVKKKRGIFSTVVYSSLLEIEGYFDMDNEDLKKIQEKGTTGDKFYISTGITDLRGIGNKSKIKINGKNVDFNPGLYNHEVTSRGIHVPIPISELEKKKKIEFVVTLELNGSSDMFFTPVGKVTETQINSPWPDPSFTGNFLPSEKKITEEGFTSTWSVNYLNRNYPQSWWDSDHHVEESSFGVNFLIPVNHYQKSTRAAKYAFMFIALTFLVFFLTEVITRTRIHPIQYLLVGFALIIFYTLLISLAEHIGFNNAYFVSTLAVTLLIGYYIKTSTKSTRIGLISGSLLLVLYGYLFTTLQLQDLSLLMGSVGLFLVLAIIMIVSRRVNWYKEETDGDV